MEDDMLSLGFTSFDHSKEKDKTFNQVVYDTAGSSIAFVSCGKNSFKGDGDYFFRRGAGRLHFHYK